MKWIAPFLYIGSIVIANYAIQTFGVVPVGFGYVAPAGVYVVGLSFWFRDMVQDVHGKRWAILCILIGVCISALMSPQLALASGVAFFLSETLDMAVYTPLRSRNMYVAIAVSNIVGLVIDSAVFLFLAFGSLVFLPGQIIGKSWMTLLALVIVYLMKSTSRTLSPAK